MALVQKLKRESDEKNARLKKLIAQYIHQYQGQGTSNKGYEESEVTDLFKDRVIQDLYNKCFVLSNKSDIKFVMMNAGLDYFMNKQNQDLEVQN